jgi:hypothetical protein
LCSARLTVIADDLPRGDPVVLDLDRGAIEVREYQPVMQKV